MYMQLYLTLSEIDWMKIISVYQNNNSTHPIIFRKTWIQQLTSNFNLQRATKNINKFKDDSKWLKDNLEELLQDSDDANAQQERRQLETLLGRFNNLAPSMEKTSDKSALFSKAYDFRDGIDRRFSWLDDAQKQVMEDAFIDGLEDARTCLHEHEVGHLYFVL